MTPRAARRAVTALAAFALLALAPLAGCGEGDSSAPARRPVETVDPLPELPTSWHEHVNIRGGFAIGLPRGWEARIEGTSSVITSFDRLVAITITADRTNEGLEIDPGEFASRAARAVTGYTEPLEPGSPRPYEHEYEGASVSAEGESAETGVRQEVEVIVLEREGLAKLTVVVARNAARRADAAARLAERAIATLRTRPVRVPAR